MTCTQYKLSRDSDGLFKKWQESHDVRSCPKCGEGIEKNGGCMHMSCSTCKAHICWYCMAVFSDSGGCYAHMSEKHGGHTPGLEQAVGLIGGGPGRLANNRLLFGRRRF